MIKHRSILEFVRVIFIFGARTHMINKNGSYSKEHLLLTLYVLPKNNKSIEMREYNNRFFLDLFDLLLSKIVLYYFHNELVIACYIHCGSLFSSQINVGEDLNVERVI